ncbi:MAG: response regulator transcription factor [Lachnospiraceae bacterium]|nr:response regulator transcription factor [Lachnospiraceae bacterium]MBR4808296.1 response regulator transcription factor [Lachnospiraceae bacterium]
MKILIVEDEEGLREALIRTMTGEGYLADGAADGEEGYSMICSGLYDLVLLDIMLPVFDGLEVLRRIRKQGITVPVIMLTARSTVEDKVGGMDLGADDYLTKPFAMPELLARIRMVTRRGAGSPADDRLRAGDLILDTQTYTLSCADNDRSVRLGAKEYQLMEYFMRNASQILSRDQITQRVWGYESDAEYNNVDVYVSFLRKKMKFVQSGSKITSVRGVGYELEVSTT